MAYEDLIETVPVKELGVPRTRIPKSLHDRAYEVYKRREPWPEAYTIKLRNGFWASELDLYVEGWRKFMIVGEPK